MKPALPLSNCEIGCGMAGCMIMMLELLESEKLVQKHTMLALQY